MSKKDNTPEAAGPEAVKIKDVPEAAMFAGSLLLKQSPVEFCPNMFLDKIGYPPEKRPVFVLRPLSALDRHRLEADGRRMSTEGLLWARQNNVDISDKNNFALIINKFTEYSDWAARREITRRAIIGFKNGEGIGDFVKAAADDGLSQELFDRLPDELVAVIENELTRLANLTTAEALGL